jgi:hypothetical protein
MPYKPKYLRNDLVAPLGFSKPLTKTGLATHLECSERYLEEEVRAGRLRCIRLSSRAVRFLPKDIEAWLSAKASVGAAQ